MSSSEPLARPGTPTRPHEATVPRATGGSFPQGGAPSGSAPAGSAPSGSLPSGSVPSGPGGPRPGGYPAQGYPPGTQPGPQGPARPQGQPRSPLQPRQHPGQPGVRSTGRGLLNGMSARMAAPRQPRPQPRPAGAPRTVRLSIARVDPWSILKLSFLLSVAIGIATVVCAVVLWSTVNGMGVFDDINKFVNEISGQTPPFDIKKYIGLDNVVSLSTVIAVVNVALLTALFTLGSFLYNLASSLVGGLHVTLSDD